MSKRSLALCDSSAVYEDSEIVESLYEYKPTFRAGKWLPEEEAYTAKLISYFQAGVLLDCEEGCSLRTYLSEKLHCSKMRISKKFAGRSIGKVRYAP